MIGAVPARGALGGAEAVVLPGAAAASSREIHAYRRVTALPRGGVASGASVEDVVGTRSRVTRVADERVVATAAEQAISPGPSLERVVPGACSKNIGAIASEEVGLAPVRRRQRERIAPSA